MQVQTFKLRGVVERLAHRIKQTGVLVEHLKVQLVRPPVTVRVRAGPACERALAFSGHASSDFFCFDGRLEPERGIFTDTVRLTDLLSSLKYRRNVDSSKTRFG